MSAPLDVVRRFVIEYQTGGNESVADELLGDDFVDRTPFPGFPGTKEGVIQLFRMLRAAMPDLRAEIQDQFAGGDKVTTRKVFYGTHLGPLLGAPPTGRVLAIGVIDIVRVANGKMVEHWNVVDVAGLQHQLSTAAVTA